MSETGGPAELVSIILTARRTDGSYVTRILQGEDLQQHCALLWGRLAPEKGGEHIAVDYYRAKGDAAAARAAAEALARPGSLVFLKDPRCSGTTWP